MFRPCFTPAVIRKCKVNIFGTVSVPPKVPMVQWHLFPQPGRDLLKKDRPPNIRSPACTFLWSADDQIGKQIILVWPQEEAVTTGTLGRGDQATEIGLMLEDPVGLANVKIGEEVYAIRGYEEEAAVVKIRVVLNVLQIEFNYELQE